MSDATPNYGPRLSDPYFRSFADISIETFGLYKAAVSTADFNDPLVFFYSRFGYIAESTSWSLRLLMSWETTLPAIALGRVRLEQVIVTSYLIHEDTKVALTPYLAHFPIEVYKNNKEAIKNPLLGRHLSAKEHTSAMKAASDAKLRVDPSFDGSDAVLNKSKWTSLDLLSMAKRRDLFTKNAKNISRHPLELSYLSFYRDSSSVVHSGSMSVSPEFMAMIKAKDGNVRIIPNRIWSRYLMMMLSTWDIVHVFELLSAMQIDRETELKALHLRWSLRRDQFFEEKSKAD
jgi:hypothetical protein